jgi:phenylacetate-CoA ligase
LHIFSDSRHVEFISEIGKPSLGDELRRIVVTDLENYAFPLLRYETGDLGRALANKCSCGINLPMMNSVRGRISDNVCFPDGTWISGEYLTTIFDDFPDAVTAFQVHQASDYSLTIKVVPNREFHIFPEVFEQVRQNLAEKACGQVGVTVKIVEEIISDRGKTRYIISDVV